MLNTVMAIAIAISLLGTPVGHLMGLPMPEEATVRAVGNYACGSEVQGYVVAYVVGFELAGSREGWNVVAVEGKPVAMIHYPNKDGGPPDQVYIAYSKIWMTWEKFAHRYPDVCELVLLVSKTRRA